ncbi:permease-like cell division protein FtsX [Crenothrix sp.]|uniref:permease-like cell division protein FtsX n=1 Tax=Crenothrix sp. TaxID=3100433 RepID=UPI00374D7113
MKQAKSTKHKSQTKPDNRKNTASRGGFFSKVEAYRDQHAHALFSSLGRMVASPFASIVTIIVLAITISLAGGFYMLVVNLQQLTGSLEDSNQISLFLKDDVSDAYASKFADSIKDNANVQSVKVISKEQGLAEFETYSGFGSAINALEVNPLPIVIQVLPKDTLEDEQSLVALFDDLKRSPEVDLAQMDMQWVKRLQSIVAIAKRGTTLLGLMLGIAVIFVTGNTIRLEVHNRRDEIVIAKLVGATNSFIQRPFLYSGFWIGLLSGVMAWFIVTIMMLILKQSVETLSALYQDAFKMLFFSYGETFILLGISCLLAVLGSCAVLQFQLRYTKLN